MFGKVLILLAVSALVPAKHIPHTSIQRNDLLEMVLNNSIECARILITDGTPELDIPSFSPLVLGERKVVIDEKYLNGTYEFKELVFDGLPNFETRKLQILGNLLSYGLYFNVSIKGVYDGEASLGNIIPLYGRGNLNLNVGIHLDGSTNFDIFNKMKLSNFKVKVAVDPNILITGIQENEELSQVISKELNGWLDKYVKDNEEKISETLSPILEYALNNAMDVTVTPEISEILEIVVRKCN